MVKKDSSFSLTKFGQSDRLKKLDSNILKISSKIDFFSLGGEHYILNLKGLERFFGFQAAIRNIAESGIENIRAADLVEDLSILESRLDEISFSRKLVQSAQDSPVLGIIPNTEIIAFSQSHLALVGEFN